MSSKKDSRVLLEHPTLMQFGDHLRTTGGALKNWFIAQSLDAVAVGIMWLIGLLILGIPFAPLWAFLGGLFQFIPNLGPVLGLIGPALTGLFSSKPERALYVLILYAIIVVIDGLFLQPYLMRRTSKVPIWASICVPIILGVLFQFWGILLAPPLLAVLYAYRAHHKKGLANITQLPENRA
jgi:predicted PurR-regulated permease PerM